LKKRTKKLLLVPVRAGRIGRVSQRTKVFCFFFSKKKYFLPPVPALPPGRTSNGATAMAA
jgi:hypothetical protein